MSAPALLTLAALAVVDQSITTTVPPPPVVVKPLKPHQMKCAVANKTVVAPKIHRRNQPSERGSRVRNVPCRSV